MDLLAHTLWVGALTTVIHRRHRLTTPTIVATLSLTVVPDLLHGLPIAWWWLFSSGTFADLRAYVFAMPGQEPTVPPAIEAWSHHLHCAMHSLVVAGGVTGLCWVSLRRFWLPLLGWWAHIALDIPTHSEAYYPVPVFYPFSYSGFDGVPWHSTLFMVLNYGALVLVGLLLAVTHRRK